MQLKKGDLSKEEYEKIKSDQSADSSKLYTTSDERKCSKYNVLKILTWSLHILFIVSFSHFKQK